MNNRPVRCYTNTGARGHYKNETDSVLTLCNFSVDTTRKASHKLREASVCSRCLKAITEREDLVL